MASSPRIRNQKMTFYVTQIENQALWKSLKGSGYVHYVRLNVCVVKNMLC